MEKVELNTQEAEWAKVLGSFTISLNDESRLSKLNTAELLARSLLSRRAIPNVRINYFTKPEYNLSNPKKSHEDIFELNGTKGEEILSHPSFLKYLKYFIYGAELPNTLESKLATLKRKHSYDDEFIEEAAPILRNYFKALVSSELNSFAEEVLKLCLDLDVELAYAKLLRNKVMTWRS